MEKSAFKKSLSAKAFPIAAIVGYLDSMRELHGRLRTGRVNPILIKEGEVIGSLLHEILYDKNTTTERREKIQFYLNVRNEASDILTDELMKNIEKEKTEQEDF